MAACVPYDTRPVPNPVLVNRSSGLPCTACSARSYFFTAIHSPESAASATSRLVTRKRFR